MDVRYSIIHPLNLSTMRYLIALCILFCGLPKNQLGAQTAQDIVYLTSGLSHQGIVIEQKPGEYIRLLRLPGRDTLQFSMDAIDRIVKIIAPAGSPLQESAANPIEPANRFNQNRYVAMLNFYIGGGKYSLVGIGMGVGRSFGDRWQAGLGVQFIHQTNSNTFPNQQIIPITADFKFKISESPKGRFAALLALSAGYSINVDDEQFDSGLNNNIRITDGVFFNPSIAFRVNVLRNAGIMFDVGYQLSSGNIYNVESGDLIDKRTWHNFAARGTLFF